LSNSEAPSQIVYVIDDDRGVRTMTSRMVGEAGTHAGQFTPYPFAGARDFLDTLPDLTPGSILLDLRMPEVDGFQLLDELKQREVEWPVVVMTGASDVASAVRAMKLGAIDYLEKPVRLDALEGALKGAVTALEARTATSERRRAARARIDRLSARELEVLQGLMAGSANKELANALGIGLRTVEMHRSNMMDRLEVGSLAEAVALAIEAGLPSPAVQEA
jgi:two-component system response regulator FixJ